MWAMMVSWLAGSSVWTRMSSCSQKRRMVCRAAGSVWGRGVMRQGRLVNSVAVACSWPFFSEPAMGWEPTKWVPGGSVAWQCWQICFLVLPTSVTRVWAERWAAVVVTRSGMMLTGAQTTTSWAWRTASAGVSGAWSHQVCCKQCWRVEVLRAQMTIFFASCRWRAAMAREAPSRPGARMVICSNTGLVLNLVPSCCPGLA